MLKPVVVVRLRALKKVIVLLFVFYSVAFFSSSVFSLYVPDANRVQEINSQARSQADRAEIAYTQTKEEANVRDGKLQGKEGLRRITFSRAKRFVQRPWLGKPDCTNFTVRRTIKGSLPTIALASYPGSGNTWVRYLIEAASGIYTGSIYNDVNLYLQGFWGELTDWNDGVTVVQKTHDSGQNHVRSFSGGRAILLNRNPYDAIVSFHNFLYGGHTGFAPISNYQRPEFQDFFLDQTRRWLATAINWTVHSTELLTVHYEQLKDDPVPELRRILRFLQLPVDEKRLACIRKYPHAKFHRKSSSPSSKKSEKPMHHPAVDRAIRYVDYLNRRTGKQPLPLHSYNHFENRSVRAKTLSEANNEQRSSFLSMISDTYADWGPRVVQSFLQDPLTKALSDRTDGFYTWRIPFDTRFSESTLLDKDFNREKALRNSSIVQPDGSSHSQK